MTRNIQEERRPHKNLQLISEDILVNLELRQTQEYTDRTGNTSLIVAKGNINLLAPEFYI